MSRSDTRCATPDIYSGELQIRPEVDAALAALKDMTYTVMHSWKNGQAVDCDRRRRN